MNLFCFQNYCVLVDYPPNPQGLAALEEYIKQAGVVRKVGTLTVNFLVYLEKASLV